MIFGLLALAFWIEIEGAILIFFSVLPWWSGLITRQYHANPHKINSDNTHDYCFDWCTHRSLPPASPADSFIQEYSRRYTTPSKAENQACFVGLLLRNCRWRIYRPCFEVFEQFASDTMSSIKPHVTDRLGSTVGA